MLTTCLSFLDGVVFGVQFDSSERDPAAGGHQGVSSGSIFPNPTQHTGWFLQIHLALSPDTALLEVHSAGFHAQSLLVNNGGL